MPWVALIGLIIISLSIFKIIFKRFKIMQQTCIQMQIYIQRLENELKERERIIDGLQHKVGQLIKWENKSFKLEKELKAIKRGDNYRSMERLRYLEDYFASMREHDLSMLFLSTFQPRSLFSFEERLFRMIRDAKFEIVIASPWIKKQIWNKMKTDLHRFSRDGGKLLVFMRGLHSDFDTGMSDDIRAEIVSLGGEILQIKELHAKIYMIDRKEAIIASANLTTNGMECNYEAGIWLNDPSVINDICIFMDDLYKNAQVHKS